MHKKLSLIERSKQSSLFVQSFSDKDESLNIDISCPVNGICYPIDTAISRCRIQSGL